MLFFFFLFSCNHLFQIKSMKEHRETQESLSLQSGDDEDMKMYNCPSVRTSQFTPSGLVTDLPEEE